MKHDRSLVWRRVDAQSLDLTATRVVIVGGTGGIGRAFARLLAGRGARVLVVGQTFRDAGVPGIEFVPADLSLMREAGRVAAQLPAESVDLVLFTTGIFAASQREETAEGIERDMAISYLSRLVIVRAIAPRLGRDRVAKRMKPRVFIMGYPGSGATGAVDDLNAERSYRSMPVHMNTVAGNEMLVLDSARRYDNASFFGLNPGIIKTNIRANILGKGTLRFRVVEGLIGLLMQSAESYAARTAALLVSPDLEGRSGVLFDRKGRAVLPSDGIQSRMNSFLSASEALVARAR